MGVVMKKFLFVLPLFMLGSFAFAGTSAFETSSVGDGGGTASIAIAYDGGGSALAAGTTHFGYVPYDATITGWSLLADTTGSMVISVKKCAGFNCNPTTEISGTEKPTLSAAWANQDNTLSSWTTAVSADDKFAFVLDSASTIKRALLVIRVTK